MNWLLIVLSSLMIGCAQPVTEVMFEKYQKELVALELVQQKFEIDSKDAIIGKFLADDEKKKKIELLLKRQKFSGPIVGGLTFGKFSKGWREKETYKYFKVKEGGCKVYLMWDDDEDFVYLISYPQ